MLRAFMLIGLISVVALTGCVTNAQILDSYQNMAIQTILAKAQFEINCQYLTPFGMSREVVQPSPADPWRANYIIGMRGCEKNATFLVLCPEGENSCVSTCYGQFDNRTG